MTTQAQSGGGLGLPGVLLVVFIVLKLTEAIDWSWWWVLSPLWIPFALFFVFGSLALGAAGIATAATRKSTPVPSIKNVYAR